ncbi:hypothetical protein P13BB106kb_p032 [Pectobacterium phage DU_PP_V]|uniref:O-spanin n=1 Tax=Pectobacterium phage DU_PP_V TaxID=2041492 RepID=A0A2D2W6U3_9CAUD|nr:Rz-like spanin [Pectobacterium phage DU_PP_V]ATS94016.1 hypothetical protein P13BB106kb_p032 [Pectobacterium phage DU_PP_V]
MCKWKQAILPVILSILVGCTAPKTENPVSVHVDWPPPLNKCEYSFEFRAENNKPIVVLPYPDWVKLTVCRETELNYILNLTSMVCFYRADLQELRCQTKGLKPNE